LEASKKSRNSDTEKKPSPAAEKKASPGTEKKTGSTVAKTTNSSTKKTASSAAGKKTSSGAKKKVPAKEPKGQKRNAATVIDATATTDSKRLGPYELRGELGRGAMAKVWRAFDPKLEREIAIKEPLFDKRLSDDVLDEMSERFVKEGKAAARLNHPGIVTIYAADIYGKRPAIVMELIDGITLGEMLDAGPLSPKAALDVLDQLLDAVGYAHLQGVVHRDIKPDNIFITKDGRVKLADFGIAHIEDSSLTKKTQVGTVLGTPGYMAPEQAMGSAIDNRTDLFAIATIAYEMLTGQNPFGAGEGTNSTTLLYRIVHEPAPALPEIVTQELSADMRPAILAALSKDPDGRPQDAASFKAMLHGAPAPAPGSRPMPSSVLAEAAKNQTSRPKWLPYAVVGGIGAAALIAVFVFATTDNTAGMVSGTPVVIEEPSLDAPQESISEKDGVFLINVGGKVAVYYGTPGNASELDRITDIEIGNLQAEAITLLEKGIPVENMTTADALLKTYREDAEAKAAAEEEARKAQEEAQEEAQAQAQAPVTKNILYVCASDFVTLRASPSTSARAIVRINVREPVERLSESGGWTEIRYNGQTGYALSKFLSSDPNAPLNYDEW
jgi:serine/threonine protein kinase